MSRVAEIAERPAEVDPKAVARIRLKPRFACAAASEWRSSRVHEDPSLVDVEVGAGAVEFVEFAVSGAGSP